MAWGPACRQVWLLLAFLLFPPRRPPARASLPCRGGTGGAGTQACSSWRRGAAGALQASAHQAAAGAQCGGWPCLPGMYANVGGASTCQHAGCQGKRMHIKLQQPQQMGFPCPWRGAASSSTTSCATPWNPRASTHCLVQGVRFEEFDFSYYNRTPFTGLENDLANCYTNALLQARTCCAVWVAWRVLHACRFAWAGWESHLASCHNNARVQESLSAVGSG